MKTVTELINKAGSVQTKKNVDIRGKSSRKKKVLIKDAVIRSCAENPDFKFNRYKICEHLSEIMIERYRGDNVIYHSQRMGMESTLKMLNEIDEYFYRGDYDKDKESISQILSL